MKRKDFNHQAYYGYVIKGHNSPKWMGTELVKYPNDIILYQEILFNNKPDFLIETGTFKGGSALFFAHMFDIIGKGQVISVDIESKDYPKHPRITYLTGGSTSCDVLDKIRDIVGEGSCMASLDSNHHRRHVKRELVYYSKIVTPGQFMIVEDTNYTEVGKKGGPDEAVKWFMERNHSFIDTKLEDRFAYSLHPGGWLQKKYE